MNVDQILEKVSNAREEQREEALNDLKIALELEGDFTWMELLSAVRVLKSYYSIMGQTNLDPTVKALYNGAKNG